MSDVVSSTTPNGKLINPDGTATFPMLKWMQGIGRAINAAIDPSGTFDGNIGPDATINGRSTLANIVKFIDSGGVVTGPGIDFARAYQNKDTDHINDGSGNPLAGGKVAYAALVASNPVAGQTIEYDGSHWLPVAIAQSALPVAHQWLKSYDATTGEFTQTQPTFADIGGGVPASGMLVNDQRGNLAYATSPTDNGVMLVLGAASAIAVSLIPPANPPYSILFINIGTSTATITPSAGTINGAATVALLPGQSADVAYDGANFEAALISFGTVTHATTAMTAGSVIIGNGAGDIKTAPIDYGVTAPNVFTTPTIVLNGSVPGSNLVLEINNSAANGVAWTMQALAGGGNIWQAQATGTSTAPFRGYLMADATAGVINLVLSSVSGKAVASLLSTGMFGWYAGASPVSTSLDTGLSRTAAATVSVGNGTQGDASGTLRAANLHATNAVSAVIITAALTVGGTQGSMTFVDGILTAQVPAT